MLRQFLTAIEGEAKDEMMAAGKRLRKLISAESQTQRSDSPLDVAVSFKLKKTNTLFNVSLHAGSGCPISLARG